MNSHVWLQWAAQLRSSGASHGGLGGRGHVCSGRPSPALSSLAALPEPALPTPIPPFFSPASPVIWVGIWFLGFCFLANQWQHSPPQQFLLGSSSAKAAITFAFFSILIWVRRGLSPGTLCRAGVGRGGGYNICPITELPWASASPFPDSLANGKEGTPSSKQMQTSVRHHAGCP